MNAVSATIDGHFAQAAHSFASARRIESSCGGYVWSRATVRSRPRVARSHFDRFITLARPYSTRLNGEKQARNSHACKRGRYDISVKFTAVNDDRRYPTSPADAQPGGAVGASPVLHRLQTPRPFHHPANEISHGKPHSPCA